MNDTQITFIGAGNMAASLIGGLRKQGVAAEHIGAVVRHIEHLFEGLGNDCKSLVDLGKVDIAFSFRRRGLQ